MKNTLFYITLLILCLLTLSNSSTCGGNCPRGNCPLCPCGSQKADKADSNTITTYCSRNVPSSQVNCCKCITHRISSGMKTFTEYSTYEDDPQTFTYFLGMVGIGVDEGKDICNLPTDKLCYHGTGYQCAGKIYRHYGSSWLYWGADAKACGCRVTSQIEGSKKMRKQIRETIKEE